MARFRCSRCGYVYDEAVKGPMPSDFKCPVCGAPPAEFVEIEDDGESSETAANLEPPSGHANAQDPNPVRYMSEIEEMAVSGEPIKDAMATQMPLPSWDDILLLGNQLASRPLPANADVDLSTTIGAGAAKPFAMDSPVVISHMSYGALSKEAKVALAKGAAMARTATSSGEGGILEEEFKAAHGYIFEYVPNRYSVTDENLQRASAIEIKVGQGSKPGMGGHLPGVKVTPEIARVRGCEPGVDIVSPSTFPGIASVGDMSALVDSLRSRSQGRPIGIKIAAGHIEADLEFATEAGADFVTIDGRGGATGSSPMLVRDATSIPTIYALARARRFLDAEAPNVSLIVTGGLRVASDFAKAIAMGADAVAIATSALIALGCRQHRICGSNKCPTGIATQNAELRARLGIDSASSRVANFLEATYADMCSFARITGNSNIHGLSVSNLATIDGDISERCGIAFA